jgi:hypothetical protein
MVRAPLAHLHTIQAHTFGQRKWNKSWCYWGISWMHLASPHRLSIIFMHIFVWFITIFGLEAFTRAWIPIVIVFFTFCNGSLWLAHHRKKLKPLGTHTHPDPPPYPIPPIPPLHCKLHILTQCNMDFHNLIFKHLMLCIYMNAHGPYTLTQIVNKFHYDINIYTKCMSS